MRHRDAASRGKDTWSQLALSVSHEALKYGDARAFSRVGDFLGAYMIWVVIQMGFKIQLGTDLALL